ncbi:MAG: 50S ribosomal protein L21 [Phycisphaerales bacterium]|nr:50S ribosomal protein L21 [Phycisphaerales bacterium]
MYAIFEDGGKQYKVTTGDKLLIETRELGEGQSTLTFDKVLLVGAGSEAKIGHPFVPGATIEAKVVEALKTAKVRGVKFSRRKGFKKTWGHRQQMLKVEIGAIHA